MTRAKNLPRLYPIIDVDAFQDGTDRLAPIIDFAQQLLEAGAILIQYRNKNARAPEMVSHLRELQRVIQERALLIVNDRSDVCLSCSCAGVHLGQHDISAEGARQMLGSDAIVGVSTHNLQQVLDAGKGSADYIAIGPVFATATKTNPEPVVGLEFVRAARKATHKPLVAIGGITRANCRSVIEAGADSVAVISDLKESPREAAEEFLRVLA